MARTRIDIPDELLEEIDHVVGQRGRSRFLEAAARERLDRLALESSQSGDEEGSGDVEYRPWRDRRSTSPTSSTRRTDRT